MEYKPSYQAEFSECSVIIPETGRASAEMMDVACPQCGAVYHSEAAHIGKQLRCVKCGCLVAVSVRAEGVTVKQPAAFVDRSKHQTRTPSVKIHYFRRWPVYALALAVTVAAVSVVLIVLFGYRNSSNRRTANLSQIEEPTQSQQNPREDSSGERQAIDFQPEAPLPHTREVTTDEHNTARVADPRPSVYNSLPTGTRIEEDVGTNGRGRLTVENGTNQDAVVRLSDSANDQTVRWFFVQAHTSANVAQIPQGIYRLTFTSGLNWVESEDTFSWHPSYSEYEHTFDFSEQRDSEGVQYHSISVTLNPVPFGNVRTKEITRDEFLRGHHHVALQR